MEESPELIIIAGIYGSGKSFYYSERKDKHFSSIEYLNIGDRVRDKYPDVNFEEIEKTQSIYDKAWEEINDYRNSLLDNRKSFIYENSLGGQDFLNFVEKAKEVGYKIDLRYIYLDSPEASLKRVQFRYENGGHLVPEKMIRDIYPKSVANVGIYAKLVDSMVIIDNAKLFDKSGHNLNNENKVVFKWNKKRGLRFICKPFFSEEKIKKLNLKEFFHSLEINHRKKLSAKTAQIFAKSIRSNDKGNSKGLGL